MGTFIDEYNALSARIVGLNDTPNGNINPTFRIGGAGGSGTIPMVNMNFYCARVYNRILTSAEIAHNREVDVARFNIQTQVASV